MKICFYNYWHNGDLFSGKGWVRDVKRQLPNFEFSYAHINMPKTLGDLGMHHLHCDHIPPELDDRNFFINSKTYRFFVHDDILYVNTWIGAYLEYLLPNQDHASWPSLHRMFSTIYDEINRETGSSLTISDNPMDYIPNTDWQYFEVHLVDEYFERTAADKFHLFCNGQVRSAQSHLGNMQETIEELARKYPSDIFICTEKFSTFIPNIHFTDDILFGVQGGDINEIVYLSTRCSTIVGKNSGPYMYTHIRENIFDTNKTFVSFSKKPSDSYPFGVKGIGCRHLHHSGVERLADVIDFSLQGAKGIGAMESIIFT